MKDCLQLIKAQKVMNLRRILRRNLAVALISEILPQRRIIEFKPREVNRRSVEQYNESAWGRLLRDPSVRNPLSVKGKLFRRRFRVPFPVFEEILSKLFVYNLI
jgi:hypothetical protein